MKRSLFGKIIAAVLAAIMALALVSCASAGEDKNGAVDLLRDITVDPIRADEPTADVSDALMNSYLALFCATLPDDNKSSLISPLSIILALGMTADGTAGNTRAQFEDLFGMTTEQLDEATAYLTARLSDTGSKNVKFTSANSLWLAQSGVKFKTSYLERVKAAYDPSVYSVDFADTATVDAINNWVYKNTDKMIEKIIEYGDTDASTVMALVNALTFDGKWEEKFENTSDGVFRSYSGKEESATFMYSTAASYFAIGTAEGFSKNYDGGKYTFVAVMPDEKTDIFDFIASLDTKTVRYMYLSDTDFIPSVKVGMPKFTADYDYDLISALVSLGVTDALGGMADFTELAECEVGEMYVDKAIHKTHIEIDEDGTKAAAATYISTRKNAVMYDHEITLDRPFFYMIFDTESELPVFMGVMTSLTGEAQKAPEKTEKKSTAITDEMINEIKSAYIAASNNDWLTPEMIGIRSFGGYNGAVVMFIDGPFASASVLTSETVDGVVFNYSSSQHMTVYFEGKFYSLQGAFDAGLLTHDDLESIRINHARTAPYLYVESYGNNEYLITYTGNLSDLTSAPLSAINGETVEIKTVILCDADIEIYVDGEKIERSHYDSDYWGYEFVMPDHHIRVEIRPISGWKQ